MTVEWGEGEGLDDVVRKQIFALFYTPKVSMVTM